MTVERMPSGTLATWGIFAVLLYALINGWG